MLRGNRLRAKASLAGGRCVKLRVRMRYVAWVHNKVSAKKNSYERPSGVVGR